MMLRLEGVKGNENQTASDGQEPGGSISWSWSDWYDQAVPSQARHSYYNKQISFVS